MSKIIAIGGGKNGYNDRPYETKEIDEEIVKQAGIENPNFLFIGFASNDIEESYFNVTSEIFSNLNCNTDILKLNEIAKLKIVKEKIERANIIYVGGGNTLKLMTLFNKYKIDILLKKAYLKDTILCGISAGGICWCEYGNSDSRKFTSNNKNLIKSTGLGFIKILFCPHYNEIHRQENLKHMMKTTQKIPAIAFENGVALEVINDSYRFIKSIPNACVYKCYWKSNNYIKEPLEISSNFKSINELYKI